MVEEPVAEEKGKKRKGATTIRTLLDLGWVRQPDGVLVIHDVFERPEDGGQAPYRVWQRARDSGCFEPSETVGSMRVLVRTRGDAGQQVG